MKNESFENINFIETLTQIVTSADPRTEFYKKYNGAFKDALDALIPEIPVAIKTEQRSVWHVYPVFDHILETIKEINLLSRDLEKDEQKMLSFIMFFHDLGKPACRKEKIKNGKICDTFHGHNVESEKIARRVLPHLNFSENLGIMCKLILDHDFFIAVSENCFNNPTEKEKIISNALNKKILDLNAFGDGKHLMRLLCLIGIADNLAQNRTLSSATTEIIRETLALLNN